MTGPGGVVPGGVVVVGAGECGTRAALALREEGYAGPVTLVGGEPGHPYERPPLSKAVLSGAADLTPLCTPERLVDAGVTHLAGVAATALDVRAHEVALADGRVLGYERLLLATGARARPLPGALVLRSHADAVALQARLRPGTRVGVVGGGFIGLEVAATAAGLGCAVTVVEAAPRLMGRAVPERLAARVAARHAEAGVAVRCASPVARLEPGRIVLADGQVVETDVVVAGIGSAPETALAAAAGLAVADGIVVDGSLATSAPDVFAAGDCCSFPHPLYDDRRVRLESWRAAQEQGVHAARALLGDPEPYAAVPWFWSDQYELSLQVAGLPGAATEEVVRVRPDGAELWFGLDAGRLVAVAGIGTGTAVAKDVRIGELLIAQRAAPDPAALADPGVALKPLLRAPSPVG
ncbi:FAD-dependent oxidoreductase [Pseudonocardia sp. RS11V-5]|uniref:NAD(P)/FAD-dependent oxidoreductase n=1 Tax=Pseudonocardia terrae TaxID=2905831 RepID=UPI001E51FBA1|nr:FAD-dependent oxidoreductase [Pseudonocardia terrae]MCE3551845.1 FAD-dependent oxidoreductase [Pseudonocardia terrae]